MSMEQSGQPAQQPQEIAGYPVERVQVGDKSLGRVNLVKDISVIFKMADDDGGGGSGGGSGRCLGCKISKISACADLVCPDIKANDPNASCSDAILECAELACRGSCAGSSFAGGGLIVFA